MFYIYQQKKNYIKNILCSLKTQKKVKVLSWRGNFNLSFIKIKYFCGKNKDGLKVEHFCQLYKIELKFKNRPLNLAFGFDKCAYKKNNFRIYAIHEERVKP